jgi:hypothetical protein
MDKRWRSFLKGYIDDDDECLNCANRFAEVRIVHLSKA